MKEVWCKEQERRLELLTQETEVLIAERGKLEISNRLKSGTDDVAKAEVRIKKDKKLKYILNLMDIQASDSP